MTPPSKRFKPIQRLASEKERQAAASLGDALRSRQQAEQRLAELQAYQAEYLERYRATAESGATAATLRDYQVFLGRLEQALAEQQRILGAAQAQCAESKGQWRDKHARNQAMGKVVDRLRRAERQEADKREQDDQDDRNQRSR